MPRMDNTASIAQNQLGKLLLIGDGKIGKTHYAGMAALAGFNVLYMDGDVASQTLATLPDEARKRIYLMKMGDRMLGDTPKPIMIDTMLSFADSTTFVWNDSEQKRVRINEIKDADEIWKIKPAKMGADVVWVIDSWTSIAESCMLQAAQSCSVDLAYASTQDMRGVYQAAAMKATAVLKTIRSANCHIICVGHPDEYSHQTKPEGRKVKDIRENDMVVDWTKMIPKSTSKPHGLTMPKYFTDIAWAQTNRTGSEFQLNFKLREDHISGGHFKDVKSQEEYSFANLVKAIGGQIPDGSQSIEHWLEIIPAGQPMLIPESKVLDGTKATGVKGLSALVKKNK